MEPGEWQTPPGRGRDTAWKVNTRWPEVREVTAKQGVMRYGMTTFPAWVLVSATGGFSPCILTLLRLLVYLRRCGWRQVRIPGEFRCQMLDTSSQKPGNREPDARGRPLFSRQQPYLRRRYDQDSEEAGAISGNQAF